MPSWLFKTWCILREKHRFENDGEPVEVGGQSEPRSPGGTGKCVGVQIVGSATTRMRDLLYAASYLRRNFPRPSRIVDRATRGRIATIASGYDVMPDDHERFRSTTVKPRRSGPDPIRPQ